MWSWIKSRHYRENAIVCSSFLELDWVVRDCTGQSLIRKGALWILHMIVQFSRSVMSDSVTPWITACQASLSITNSRSLLKLMSIKSVMPSSHVILCCPLLLLPIPPSIRVFSNESTLCMRWPKYWSFSFSISPSNEHPGLISIMDWLHLLAVQGTRKSLLRLCVFGGNTSEEMLCFYCIIPASTQCQSIS